MKKILIFGIGVLIGGIFGGLLGGLLGYGVATSGEPNLVLLNQTEKTYSVEIQTDTNEQYPLTEIAPDKREVISLDSRDKALWVITKDKAGNERKSEEVYVTSQGTIFVILLDESILMEYEL